MPIQISKSLHLRDNVQSILIQNNPQTDCLRSFTGSELYKKSGGKKCFPYSPVHQEIRKSIFFPTVQHTHITTLCYSTAWNTWRNSSFCWIELSLDIRQILRINIYKVLSLLSNYQGLALDNITINRKWRASNHLHQLLLVFFTSKPCVPFAPAAWKS